ncbi:hypothetical protein KAR26_03315 [Candidatus Parcubacteria bacterium]|nr:hypothetical protein [Candidatus Parcubacteria bacterium]
MAITVLKEKKKQKKLVVILVALIVLIVIVNYKNFYSEPEVEQISFQQANLPSRININFNVLNSPILKILKSFELIGIEFDYNGITESGEIASGTIIGTSPEDVLRQLEELGLTDITLGEMEVGRRNPFMPY